MMMAATRTIGAPEIGFAGGGHGATLRSHIGYV